MKVHSYVVFVFLYLGFTSVSVQSESEVSKEIKSIDDNGRGVESTNSRDKLSKFGTAEELSNLASALDSSESSVGRATARNKSRSNTKNSTNCNNVTPLEKASRMPGIIRRITGDRKLRPKDKVPDFKLPQLNGWEVSLYDVLSENEFVVIDFWATACAPCIAKFPDWKKLYSAYREDGFEMVSVCTDFTKEQWAESSKEHDLPWIDVAEINNQGLVGPTSKAYRLVGLPRSYLVNSDGCILHTRIFPIELKRFLEERYGEKPELQEASAHPPES
ncbi:MAG: TlpA disulfide reductase family protein [Gammaproteobacteria bacterium]|nr:TlpA disulfide reductase family protein [Gammaproteobacteria bacterium]